MLLVTRRFPERARQIGEHAPTSHYRLHLSQSSSHLRLSETSPCARESKPAGSGRLGPDRPVVTSPASISDCHVIHGLVSIWNFLIHRRDCSCKHNLSGATISAQLLDQLLDQLFDQLLDQLLDQLFDQLFDQSNCQSFGSISAHATPMQMLISHVSAHPPRFCVLPTAQA